MIPQQLILKNFLSYREATLDFRGLHVACICGPNGAGKSSLLDAIAWVIWGQSRAASEDEIIHVGEQEAQVDFIFTSHGQTYRIIRTHLRGHASSLEFQVKTPQGFRSLTERGLRATQQAIQADLKLDYETFVNSAYLRQGRADEFMLKRPSDRKQLLSELLKLDQYDLLAERAKDVSRQFKGQVTLLERSLQSIQTQLHQGEAIAAERASLEAEINQVQVSQQAGQAQLQMLQTRQHQRQTWQQQLSWQQQRHDNLTQDLQHLQPQLTSVRQQQKELERLLQQESTIMAEYAELQRLQAEEETQNQKFQAYEAAQEQRQSLQQQQTQQINHLQGQLGQVKAQLEMLLQQEQEIQRTLSKAAEVEAGLKQLESARTHLNQLEQLQTQAFPLLKRQQQLQIQLERQTSRLSARLEELRSSTRQLQTQQFRQPQIQQAVLQVTEQIEQLEKRRIYQQRVQEKGLERRSFMERLQAHQREHQTQLAQLEQKMQLLGQPDALCPLCDRPLDQFHWALVQQKHEQQKQEAFDQLWLIREQLAVSEREIQVLRQEYRRLGQELSEYNAVLERRGQLQEQLQTTHQLDQTLQQLMVEVETVERSLQTGDYAAEIQAELQQLQQVLSQLNYDEQNHALARGQVERWRWAEIKQAEIRQAQRRQAQMSDRIPALQTRMAELQDQLDYQQGKNCTDRSEAHPNGPSKLQQQINQVDRHLAEIGYDREHHHTIRAALRQAQDWHLRHQALLQARQQYPQIQQRSYDLAQTLQTRSQDLEAITTEIQALDHQLAQVTDCTDQIQALEQQIQQQRTQLDQQFAQLGRLQQQQQQLQTLKLQYAEQQQQLQTAHCQNRIYQELTQAFGKNGIQALMIENVLPQLEAETNHLLARLSASQLHVQFVTQRAGRGRGGSHTPAKLIDTLDILIADERGTRPYETYSGGEAFRVNFSIRLALARLLSQRSGSDLQMLIIDEGFGTQDMEGCERLIAAINAIAPDFACILTVTHMPFLKEAFQTRIEVSKTPVGSQLSLLV
jgi:exonuclease SbcC